MTKVSRILIDPKRLANFYRDLWDTLTLIEDRNEAKAFYKDIFTRTEVLMFAKRIQIAKMLLKGDDYLTIRSYVRVGNSTIAKVSDWLNSSEGAKKVILRLIALEERKEEELIKPSIPAYKIKGGITLKEASKMVDRYLKRRKKRKSVEKSIHSSTLVYKSRER